MSGETEGPKTTMTRGGYRRTLGGRHRGRRCLYALLILAAVSAASSFPSAALGAEDFNTFDAVTVGPASSSTNVVKEYNSETFTLQGAEGERHIGCGQGESAFGFATESGEKSGWIHFIPAVNGFLTVTITTPEYYGMVATWRGQSEESFFHNAFLHCAYREFPQADKSKSTVAESVQANVPINIETIGVTEFCGKFEGQPSPGCKQISSETKDGGVTTVEINFVADDADHDGVPDTLDACPKEAGPASLGGCPDSDGDGIPNFRDKCPTQAGPARFEGCPDSDGDGIPDRFDKCPTQPGPATFNGCPDSDGDGVPDYLDLCASEFANASLSLLGDGRRGCPEPLKVALPYTFTATRRGMRLYSFRVEAPIGSSVTLTCRGRACPKSIGRTITTNSPITSVVPVHVGRSHRAQTVFIPVGTTVSVTVTHNGTLGKRRSLTPRRHGPPKRVDLCVTALGGIERCPT
jgi:hypothetical protein